MTLLVGIAHPQYAILLSDRLLTTFGTSTPLAHQTKSGVLQTDDATMLYAYTGLARSGNFEAGRWITELLLGAGKAKHDLQAVLQAATESATKYFCSERDLLRVNAIDRRLMVMFLGFAASGRIAYAELSNCTDAGTGKWLGEAKNEFAWGLMRSDDMSTRPRFICWQGATTAISDTDFDRLDSLVGGGKPIIGVVTKAVDIIRDIAGRSASNGTIGKDVLAGFLDAATLRFSSEFFPYRSSPSAYAIDRVDIRSAGDQLATVEMSLTQQSAKFIDPLTRRRQPCPCGSGKQFRFCHGKRR